MYNGTSGDTVERYAIVVALRLLQGVSWSVWGVGWGMRELAPRLLSRADSWLTYADERLIGEGKKNAAPDDEWRPRADSALNNGPHGKRGKGADPPDKITEASKPEGYPGAEATLKDQTDPLSMGTGKEDTAEVTPDSPAPIEETAKPSTDTTETDSGSTPDSAKKEEGVCSVE